jgi:antibiotic biosynthesis monooxygenase (ABM) superfamily enzyme
MSAGTPIPKAPPRHKTAVLTWLAIYPTVALVVVPAVVFIIAPD